VVGMYELTDIRSRDVLVLTLASLFSTVAGYLIQFGLYDGGMGCGYEGRDDHDNKVGSMIIVIVAAMLTWVISFLIIRAIPCYREFAADRGAAHMTCKPVKLASALLKISSNMRQIPTKDLRHVEGLNTFFIIPALTDSTAGNLFSAHPPVEKQIKKLMQIEVSTS
jgi:heat shock protein HtpX